MVKQGVGIENISRGESERKNTNGLLRQYFPEATDLNTVTQGEVNRAVHRLNTRSRKDLDFETPAQNIRKHRAVLSA